MRVLCLCGVDGTMFLHRRFLSLSRFCDSDLLLERDLDDECPRSRRSSDGALELRNAVSNVVRLASGAGDGVLGGLPVRLVSDDVFISFLKVLESKAAVS